MFYGAATIMYFFWSGFSDGGSAVAAYARFATATIQPRHLAELSTAPRHLATLGVDP